MRKKVSKMNIINDNIIEYNDILSINKSLDPSTKRIIIDNKETQIANLKLLQQKQNNKILVRQSKKGKQKTNTN
jgi:hypothetical protein